jgi:hypothetical protein
VGKLTAVVAVGALMLSACTPAVERMGEGDESEQVTASAAGVGSRIALCFERPKCVGWVANHHDHHAVLKRAARGCRARPGASVRSWLWDGCRRVVAQHLKASGYL